MSYLLDKKLKQKKLSFVIFGFLLFLFVFYFRVGIWNNLSGVSHTIFRPVFVAGNSIGGKFKNFSAFFISKKTLDAENKNLRDTLLQDETRMANYETLLAENISLKEILGRAPAQAEKNTKVMMVVAAILSKPNQSAYDTLIIDAGATEGFKKDDMVFAKGDIPIGRIAEVYQNSSKVILFSSSGEKTQVVAPKNIFMEAVGRGGGNFEVIMPSDSTLVKGNEVVLTGINPYILGIVQSIISDSRSLFQKALISSPVNVQELKFVQVLTQN